MARPELVERLLQLHSGSADERQEEEGSGLRDFHVEMPFKLCQEVAGLDLGHQILLSHYPLHREVHAEHGLMTYSQSQRCKVVQSVYHVSTMGVGTSVRKFVILLLNTKEDVEVVERWWPDRVDMGDFRALVLQRTVDYTFCRKKIQKGAFTFYLYYVKKQGSKTGRREAWLQLMTAVFSMENVTDWAKVVTSAMGQAANHFNPFQPFSTHFKHL